MALVEQQVDNPRKTNDKLGAHRNRTFEGDLSVTREVHGRNTVSRDAAQTGIARDGRGHGSTDVAPHLVENAVQTSGFMNYPPCEDSRRGSNIP